MTLNIFAHRIYRSAFSAHLKQLGICEQGARRGKHDPIAVGERPRGLDRNTARPAPAIRPRRRRRLPHTSHAQHIVS